VFSTALALGRNTVSGKSVLPFGIPSSSSRLLPVLSRRGNGVHAVMGSVVHNSLPSFPS